MNRTQHNHDIPPSLLVDAEQIFTESLAEVEQIYHTISDGSCTIPSDIGIKTFIMHRIHEHLKERDLTYKERHIYMMVFHSKFLYECIINGCNDLDDLSVNQYGTFHWLDGKEPVLTNGYGDVIYTMLSEITGVDIVYNSPVTLIQEQPEIGLRTGKPCGFTEYKIKIYIIDRKAGKFLIIVYLSYHMN